MEIHHLVGKPHQHIVETLGAFQYGDTFSIIFPLAERNLEEYLQKEERFTSDYVWEQMSGISDGLAYLHGLQNEEIGERNMKDGKQEQKPDSVLVAYHLDLKPENILIMHGAMQIADFGLSKVKDKLLIKPSGEYSSSGSWNEGGYKAYAPPEHMRSGIKHYVGHDLWSLGAIFSEVATHDICYTDAKTNEGKDFVVQYRIRRQMDNENGELVRPWCFHDGHKLKKSVHEHHINLLKAAQSAGDTKLWQSAFYQQKFLELITQMLATDPIKRGSASDVAKTLENCLKETSEEQAKKHPKSLSSHLRSPTRVIQTIWEEAESHKLQKDYGKPEDILFL